MCALRVSTETSKVRAGLAAPATGELVAGEGHAAAEAQPVENAGAREGVRRDQDGERRRAEEHAHPHAERSEGEADHGRRAGKDAEEVAREVPERQRDRALHEKARLQHEEEWNEERA